MNIDIQKEYTHRRQNWSCMVICSFYTLYKPILRLLLAFLGFLSFFLFLLIFMSFLHQSSQSRSLDIIDTHTLCHELSLLMLKALQSFPQFRPPFPPFLCSWPERDVYGECVFVISPHPSSLCSLPCSFVHFVNSFSSI